MTWDKVLPILATVISIISVFVTVLNKSIMKSVEVLIAEVRVEMANFKTQIATGRSEDREEMRDWINGSFLRAREVNAKMETLEAKINAANHE